MKKSLKIHPIKENIIHLFWMLVICISMLQSCSKNKYRWEPGISAPKFYPVAGNVDFENVGNGSNTSFAPGWGQSYGAIVSNKWKDVPKEVSIDYYSVVDGKGYKGKVSLPQKKIRDLFNEYHLNSNDNLGHLVVGMAPGGWIRVWFQTINTKSNHLVNVEVVKGQLKEYKNETVGVNLKTKDFKTWGNTYIYWQHHGIPLEAWADNEKEYDIIFDFYKQENKKVGFNYVSADGTYYQKEGEKVHQKLPVQFNPIAWHNKSGNVYECNLPMPKNFKKYVEHKKVKELRLELEIESDDEHGIIYLVTNKIREKIVRFKSTQPTVEEKKNNSYSYATDIEYFIP
ncbi:hypothetical protein B0A70_08240 [Chryseobacterium piscicola]|nr:hypothetical protein B0A70_08240 [Chryseobacterium piscicola]